MPTVETRARTLLRKFPRIDSWFVAKSGLNLYRGCAHDCAWCDGRAEKYRVEGDFARDVGAKVNAREVLLRELAPRRRNAAPPVSGFLLRGGGVGDSYQPAEASCRIARGCLELCETLDVPVHVLTKSSLVLRDIDILGRMADRGRAIVSFSLSSADDGVSALFEPGAPPPSQRLAALRSLTQRGVPAGVFLLPVIPFVTDAREAIDASLSAIAAAGARWAVFGGMTLKEGRQREHFLAVLSRARPDLVPRVESLYPGDTWGRAAGDYFRGLGRTFAGLAPAHRLFPRIPQALFRGLVRPEDLPVLILDQVHALREMLGEPSRFGRAAFELSRRGLAGAGLDPESRRPVEEITRTGTARLSEDLLSRFSPGTAAAR